MKAFDWCGANDLVKLAGKSCDDGPAWGLPREFGLGVARETDSQGETFELVHLGGMAGASFTVQSSLRSSAKMSEFSC